MLPKCWLERNKQNLWLRWQNVTEFTEMHQNKDLLRVIWPWGECWLHLFPPLVLYTLSSPFCVTGMVLEQWDILLHFCVSSGGSHSKEWLWKKQEPTQANWHTSTPLITWSKNASESTHWGGITLILFVKRVKRHKRHGQVAFIAALKCKLCVEEVTQAYSKQILAGFLSRLKEPTSLH